MWRENVEIVREAFDVFNAFFRGELTDEAAAEHEVLDPQLEFHWHDERVPDAPQLVRGARELAALAEQYRGAWVNLDWEPLEFIEAPDDRLVTPIRQSGRGREAAARSKSTSLRSSRSGTEKVTTIELFRHHADALEAAGLSE